MASKRLSLLFSRLSVQVGQDLRPGICSLVKGALPPHLRPPRGQPKRSTGLSSAGPAFQQAQGGLCLRQGQRQHFLAALGPGWGARRNPCVMISVFCWEITVTTAVTVAVIEIAIVVGFRGEQVWPFVSGRGALEDTGDLSPQLSLIPPQGNSLI